MYTYIDVRSTMNYLWDNTKDVIHVIVILTSSFDTEDDSFR